MVPRLDLSVLQLVAMRYNDIRDGTNVIDEVLPKYKAALTEKGMLGSDGLYASFYAVKQKKAIAARHGAHTAWYVSSSSENVLLILTNVQGQCLHERVEP